MNLRAMDAVFPVREKSVNRINSLNDQLRRRKISLEALTQFEQSENYVPIFNESSLKGAAKS